MKNLLYFVSFVVLLIASSILSQDINAPREGIDTSQGTGQNNAQHKPPDSSHKPSTKFLGRSYQWLDIDGDGRISKAEFDAAFTKMDVNGDGYLSAEELRSSIGQPAAVNTNPPHARTGQKEDTKSPTPQ
jgi:EF hand domain-containing protein